MVKRYVPDRFGGKTMVIVGGSGGVGRAAVTRALAEGARVAVLDLQPTASDEWADAHAADKLLLVPVDVSDEESVVAAAQTVLKWTPRVHSLLYFVGAIGGGPLEEVSLEEWDRLHAINNSGAFLLFRAIVPHYVDHGGGTIVATSSVSALVAGIGKDIAYKSAKAALIQLSRSVAVDYAAQGVRANVVVPGPIATAFGRDGRVASDDELATRSGATVPLGRRATPEEIASAALWLASDDSSYVTGVAMPVDGGFLAI